MPVNKRVWLLIGLLSVCALALRIYDLDGPTITHPEAYVPGIDLPEFANHPGERQTFDAIVRGTRATDIPLAPPATKRSICPLCNSCGS